MNHSKTDLLGWEKWFIGYTKDSQVSCIDPKKETKVWLRPSGIRTDAKKLAVIPISSTKVVVLESMRAVGLNYKLGKSSQGLLVWTVDTTDPRESYGVEMVTLSNRKLTYKPFVYYDAPLKKGEQVKVAGLTIRVIEAGKYGDVFSVASSN
jgi:hypothetical protein